MFLASIHDTPFHAVAYHVKEVLLRERTIHRQEHTWRSLLYQQTGFDQAAVRIAPTPCCISMDARGAGLSALEELNLAGCTGCRI